MNSFYARVPVLEPFFRLLRQSRYLTLQQRVNAALSGTASEKYHNFTQKYQALSQRILWHCIASYLGIKPKYLDRVQRLTRWN